MMRSRKTFLNKSSNKFLNQHKFSINDGIIMKKKNSSTQQNTCSGNIQQYLVNSTLHGLRYVGDRNISMVERLFYGLAFVGVFLLSAYFISNIWEKWSATPIIIALNSRVTSIGSIPFPAITICNMNQAKNNFAKHVKTNSMDEVLLESLCSGSYNINSSVKYIGKWSTFRLFLLKATQSCSEMLLFCKFAADIEMCKTLFETSLTDEGRCCTFNTVHPMYLLQNYNNTNLLDNATITEKFIPFDWTPETGYPTTNLPFNLYPRRAAGPGSQMGLSVILNVDLMNYYCSSTNSAGFKILLHSPTETPKISDYGFSVSPGRESRIVIKPIISDSSTRIRNVPKHVRQCIFANEGNLTYFRTYSRKNCEMECEAYFINEKCGCILYYMPRIHENITICKRQDNICYDQFKLYFNKLMENENEMCKCLPGCFEINYKSEVTSAILGDGEFKVQYDILDNLRSNFSSENIAILHFYYEETSYRSYSKEELIGFTEFLSNTGGLLGLFMGFSVISLIEIIYFLTLRPYCANKRAVRKQNKIENSQKNDDQIWKKDKMNGLILTTPTKSTVMQSSSLYSSSSTTSVTQYFPYIE